MNEPAAGIEKLSFVIPAYNEAENIGRCVASIHAHVPHGLDHEVIVVDNGSADETAALARAAGADVISSSATTIAAVRNEGVAKSSGDVLVFLDGDCALTPAWSAGVVSAITTMLATPGSCAGSQVSPPPDHGRFAEHWYGPFMERAAHIGSAHLMCSRSDFDKLGGFDEQLTTGEDYDFCMKCKAAGGRVMDFPSLRVDHYDFPQTWAAFVGRERWHGHGDATSLRAIASSKVAITSSVYMTLITAGVILPIFGHWPLGLAMLAAAAALVVASSFARLRGVPWKTRAYSIPIFAAYYLGRSLSVLDGLWEIVTGRSEPGREDLD